MNLIRHIARTAMSGYFVAEGLQALRSPGPRADALDDAATQPLARKLPGLAEADTETVIKVNGGVQVAGGALLALNKTPRAASTALAASMVPPTVAMHRFWEAPPERRAQERMALLKNLAIWGGVVVAAMDTQGQPGVAWRTQHALEHAELEAEHRRELAGVQADLARERTRRKAIETQARAAEVQHDVARRAAEVAADVRARTSETAGRVQATARQAAKDAKLAKKAAKATGRGAATVGRTTAKVAAGAGSILGGAAAATGRGAKKLVTSS